MKIDLKKEHCILPYSGSGGFRTPPQRQISYPIDLSLRTLPNCTAYQEGSRRNSL